MRKYTEKEFLKLFKKQIIKGTIIVTILGPFGLLFLKPYIHNIKRYNLHKESIKQCRELDKQTGYKSEMIYVMDNGELVEVQTIVKDSEGKLIGVTSSEDNIEEDS